MRPKTINLSERLAEIEDCWRPKIVAQVNDYQLKLVKLQGDFIWHSHPETDEAFLVLDGDLCIALRDGEVRLGQGELAVVPKGVEHKPFSKEECHVLLIEPAGTRNTGDTGGERTGEVEWV